MFSGVSRSTGQKKYTKLPARANSVVNFLQQSTMEVENADNTSFDSVDELLLPPESFEFIFSFLDFPSCSVISQVSRFFNYLNNSQFLWSHRVKLVRVHCDELTRLSCLPDDYELNSLFSTHDYTRKVSQCRLGMR
jgi:hypothetical protein